jgi:hypothetical protein
MSGGKRRGKDVRREFSDVTNGGKPFATLKRYNSKLRKKHRNIFERIKTAFALNPIFCYGG